MPLKLPGRHRAWHRTIALAASIATGMHDKINGAAAAGLHDVVELIRVTEADDRARALLAARVARVLAGVEPLAATFRGSAGGSSAGSWPMRAGRRDSH